MKKILLLTLLLTSSLYLQDLQAQVRIDGSFTEWEVLNTEGYTEAAEESSGADLSAVSVTNDEEFVYFYLQADKPFKLHDNEYPLNPTDVLIYLDIDMNAATGQSVSGIGADLIIEAGDREVLYISETGTTAHSLNDIGLISLPTATSAEYEIALSREGLTEVSSPLFSTGAFRYVVKEANSGDLLPNEGSLTYTLQNDIQQNYTPVSLEQVQTDKPQIRLLTHNVLHDGLTERERTDHFARIYKALQPDVLTLNENWDTTPEEARAFFNNHLPSGTPHGWYASKVVYGNLTVSRYPIVKNWEVYAGNRIAASLIDLPDSVYPRDMVVINSHLRCCNEDKIRQQEVDALVAFMLDAQTEGGVVDLPANTPVVISGDLNLVGDGQQLQTLLTGDIQNTGEFGAGGAPDWDGSPLQDLKPLHTDHPFAYTWYNAESYFPAGRMDFIIYTNSILEVQKSFILNISETPEEKLAAYGLSAADAAASDHLPLVADFTMTGCNSTPAAEVSFSGLPDTVIVSAPALTLSGQPAQGEFWGPGLEENIFNPSVAGLGVHTIKYIVWNEEGCSSASSRQVVVRACNENEIPDAGFSGLPDSLLTTDSPVTLVPATDGGTFSGTGITENTFDPSAAGPGTFSISYTVENESGCSNTESKQVVVQRACTGTELPDAGFSGLPDTLLTTDQPVTLTATTGNGTFSGTGVSGNTFDPSVAGPGTFEIVYTVENEFGCSNSSSQEVTVTEPAPTAIQDPLLEELSLVPNPAISQFRVLLSEVPSEPVIMNIYTADGRRVKQQELKQQETIITLDKMPAGLLFIRMNTRKGQKVFRLLKEQR